MAFSYFSTWTEAELLIELRKVEEEIMRGSQVVSAGAGDVSTSVQIQIDIRERWLLIMQALNALNPVTYPLGADRARFTFSTPTTWLANP